MSVECPLLIAGRRIFRDKFVGFSPYYEGYQYSIANASSLDISRAIGLARKAEIPSFLERADYLERAADLFSYSQPHLEHTVRMTGMPIRVVRRLLDQIPQWLRQVSLSARTRYPGLFAGNLAEELDSRAYKLLITPSGFAYAATPGNDPRASALAAANLAIAGIPFILAPSPKDAIAPLVVEALLRAGFSPNSAQVLYFNRQTGAKDKHMQLVDASSILWTFGPDISVDALLRYETSETQINPIDHFEDKLVLRHNSGNCASILSGELNDSVFDLLSQSLDFPLGCMTVKTLLLMHSPENTIARLREWLDALQVGDPLEEVTEVGYIHPKNLDYLEKLLHKHALRLASYGGERLSPQQARPVLIVPNQEIPEIFAQEIPAYLLSAYIASSIEDAVNILNRHTPKEPRLSVALWNFPEKHRVEALRGLKAHTVLGDKPTSYVLPYFHEGNDYLHILAQDRLFVL